uniref:Copper amine oxidase-like N-terminal domain-containing protein n=1 Tax=uncultured Bacillota bacterium TaxID=344338 RepID=A0A650F4P3_9FIRM|nr:hypothetical protein Firmicute1046_1610 [uncultured Firmicutes bacterium]
MKNLLKSIGLSVALTLSLTACTAANEAKNNVEASNNGITVTVNNSAVAFDQEPIIENGRTLVPVRAIFEALGASVNWDGDTQTVTSKRGSINIVLTIGSNMMSKNGKDIEIEVPAQTVNDRTVVPVRAVAEAFGCNVDWDNGTQTVVISETENTSNEINLNHTYTTRLSEVDKVTCPTFSFDYSDNWTITKEELHSDDDVREVTILNNNRGVTITYLECSINGEYGSVEAQYEILKAADSQFTPSYFETDSGFEDILGKFMVARVATVADKLARGDDDFIPFDIKVEQYAVLPQSCIGTAYGRALPGMYKVMSFEYPIEQYAFIASAPEGGFTDEERAEVVAILSSFREV